jgi:hypothetical protein
MDDRLQSKFVKLGLKKVEWVEPFLPSLKVFTNLAMSLYRNGKPKDKYYE